MIYKDRYAQNLAAKVHKKTRVLTDDVLLELLLENDATGYRALVERYGTFVYNIVLGILQHTNDAEDVTQEVFLQVFQSIQQFKGNSKLSTWIYRIAVTKSLEMLRHQKRKKRFGHVQSIHETRTSEAPHFVHPGVLMEQQENARFLFRAIEQLPEKQKTAFLLHKMEDMPYAEIASVMDLSIPAIESLLFRAKQQLRKILSTFYENNKD
ncbi:MAG: RNA polymerase sigma factor [Bacteroidetes bacterium]|nr:RNA polymerase sigma factor [Bacteroidota bacterium]